MLGLFRLGEERFSFQLAGEGVKKLAAFLQMK